MTLLLGWLIWAIILAAQGRGQTPAKQVLNMRIVKLRDGEVARFGTMVLRELLGKWLVGIAVAFTLIGVILYFWLLWDANRQELWDKIAGTVVVDDPQQMLYPATAGQISGGTTAGTLPPPA